MRRNRFSKGLALAAMAVATLVLTTAAGTARATIITGTAGGPNGSHDTWNNAANWDAGIPSGAVDAVVGTGVTAEAWNTATPAYTGSLTLENNSTLQMGWTTSYPESLNALGVSGVTMNSGSAIRLRMPAPNPVVLPEITMAGDGSIHLSPSTSAHHRARDFDNPITGPGALTLIGNNNNTANLNVDNPGWSGGFVANADDSWRIEANVTGAFGTGDVTLNGRSGVPSRGASLQIDALDVIDDTATLFLNGGRDHRKAAKLILNFDETVADFWLDGVQMAAGAYDSSSGLLTSNGDPLISGTGILTVEPPSVGGPEPLLVDFNSTNQSGGPHNQAGFEPYDAGHEVAGDFDTKTYSAFGTTVSVTPDWPNTTDNRVRQMIDRGSGNDANWDNAEGDIDLVTDWLGTDTRTGNGGNGNWDGTTGTPTYLTLTLGDLPAGGYDWKSFHHDTENVHVDFTVEISTDGGITWGALLDGLMTDSTPGGNPDSSGFTPPGPWAGPDANSLPSTFQTSFLADGTNDVLLRFAPLSNTAVHRQLWGINGFELSQAAAVPEPSTFVLTALGLLGLAWYGRRRRRS